MGGNLLSTCCKQLDLAADLGTPFLAYAVVACARAQALNLLSHHGMVKPRLQGAAAGGQTRAPGALLALISQEAQVEAGATAAAELSVRLQNASSSRSAVTQGISFPAPREHRA